MKINIVHLYPELLNLYGDRGNVIVLKKRCEWRGISADIIPFSIDREFDLKEADIIFLGGGSDKAQSTMYAHFLNYKDVLKEQIEKGTVVLAICGGYQLLGKAYIDAQGKEMEGLGVFDYYTKSEDGRLIGNIIIENNLGIKPLTVVGFENHGGRTYHNYHPFGTVVKGYGNNGKDHSEGIVYKNCIGTYLHGPLLSKNPHIADYLIAKALKRKYGVDDLKDLKDAEELKAHDNVIKLYA